MWKCKLMSGKVRSMKPLENDLVNPKPMVMLYRRVFVSLVMFLALWLAACNPQKCHFNSDCEGAEICSAGTCVITCEEASDCPSGHICTEGICEHHSTSCDDDGGCSDGGALDGGETPRDAALERDSARQPIDMGVARDRGVAVMDRGVVARPDMALDIDQGFGGAPDGGGSGGGGVGLQNLDGVYTVSSRVIVATGGTLEAEDVERKLVRLTQLNSGRYRVEQYDLDGAREYMIPSASFTAPEGPGRFQYEYQRRTPERANCDLLETRFERGRYDVSANGYRLTGAQERRFELVGERCSSAVYMIRLETTWTALP